MSGAVLVTGVSGSLARVVTEMLAVKDPELAEVYGLESRVTA